MTDIFDDTNKIKSNFWTYKTIGEEIQGTYIGKRQVINQLTGKEQWIYDLKVDAEFWSVGGKPGIDNQMRNVRIGQVLGFKYVEERPSKKPGMNPAKIVQVFANPNIVDEKWLQEQEEVNMGGTEDTEKSLGNGEVNDNPTSEKLNQIGQLAKEKLGITNPDEVEKAVMEVTNLAFLEPNYDQIIEILKTK